MLIARKETLQNVPSSDHFSYAFTNHQEKRGAIAPHCSPFAVSSINLALLLCFKGGHYPSSSLSNTLLAVFGRETLFPFHQDKLEPEIPDYSALFWENWLQHESYLYRCCLSWLNYNQSDSEDLLHQGMLKAYQKFSQYAERIRCVKAWLRQLLFHLYLDHYRSKNSQRIFIEFSEEKLSNADYSSPWSVALTQELEERFQQSLNQLPLTLYQAFYLRFYEEQAYTDIARSLSITPVNARKRVQLARKKIKQGLNTYLGNKI